MFSPAAAFHLLTKITHNKSAKIYYTNKTQGPKITRLGLAPERVVIEKMLIQFWNPLLMAGKIGDMRVPTFSPCLKKSHKLCGCTACYHIICIQKLSKV